MVVLRIVRRDQLDQCTPGNDTIHLVEENLLASLFDGQLEAGRCLFYDCMMSPVACVSHTEVGLMQTFPKLVVRVRFQRQPKNIKNLRAQLSSLGGQN